jgi:hypothetical protein
MITWGTTRNARNNVSAGEALRRINPFVSKPTATRSAPVENTNV